MNKHTTLLLAFLTKFSTIILLLDFDFPQDSCHKNKRRPKNLWLKVSRVLNRREHLSYSQNTVCCVSLTPEFFFLPCLLSLRVMPWRKRSADYFPESGYGEIGVRPASPRPRGNLGIMLKWIK